MNYPPPKFLNEQMGQLDHEYNKFTTAKQMSVILDSKLVTYSPMILIIVIGLSYEGGKNLPPILSLECEKEVTEDKRVKVFSKSWKYIT